MGSVSPVFLLATALVGLKTFGNVSGDVSITYLALKGRYMQETCKKPFSEILLGRESGISDLLQGYRPGDRRFKNQRLAPEPVVRGRPL